MPLNVFVQLDKRTSTLNGGAPNHEHCSLDAKTLQAYPAGRQILIRRDVNRFALFTVMDTPNDATPDLRDVGVVRMGVEGIERLGGLRSGCAGLILRATVADFDATLTSRFLTPFGKGTFQRETALIETLAGDGDEVAVLAPHGGNIEPYTDRQAVLVYETLRTSQKSVRLWMCHGRRKGGDAHKAWHITSTEISPLSFPELGVLFQTRFAHAVAFHGWEGGKIAIGGLADAEFRGRFVEAINRETGNKGRVDLAENVTGNVEKKEAPTGRSPQNIVNAITRSGRGGVQIEQPLDLRQTYHEAIAMAVADVYRSL